MDEVILVNDKDQEIGKMEKLEAHQKGLLHRAFSIFIFNTKGELLLQKRALHKYHSPGLWTNTCCSHPKPNETNLEAANRRLKEEMGMKADLSHAFHFIYHVEFENGLIEHEFDHVFYAYSDEIPKINPDEVHEYKYISNDELLKDMDLNPKTYTEWFKLCYDQLYHHIKK